MANEEKRVATPTGNSRPVADGTRTNSDGNQEQRSNNRRKPRNAGGNSRRPRNERPSEFEERVVTIRRVTKVTKGGRHFRFAAVVVVGNRKGQVGFGTGKANEVPDAIKKAVKEANKHLVTIPMRGTTIPHEVLGTFGAGKVLIKPAKEGTGVIAGGPARSVIELAGISDIYAKSLGSNTPINMIRATLEGLSNLQTRQRVQELRFGHEEEKVDIVEASTGAAAPVQA